MKLQILLTFVLIGYNQSLAQSNIKMINSSVIDTDKYKEYDGSPFLWKENREVIIYDVSAKEYKSIKGNYNGLENEFEIYQNGKFIQLPHSTYPIVKVVDGTEVQFTLVSNIHPKLKNKYCIQHFKTANYSVLESFTAKKSNVKVQTPGKATEFKKINKRKNYYLLYGEELIEFKIKKKKLIKKFGHKKEIKAFLKEQKIKIKKIKDVLLLFDFLESKGWLAPTS